jgi:hypothetical protein
VRGAGFRVVGQRYVFRLPLLLAFPTFLTEAEPAPELAPRAEAGEGNPRSEDQSWR